MITKQEIDLELKEAANWDDIFNTVERTAKVVTAIAVSIGAVVKAIEAIQKLSK